MEPSRVDSPRVGCPRKSYMYRMNSNSMFTSDPESMLNASGLDVLANIASPKGRRVHVDSFSNVSLPDEMRISFSESEFQMDDIDFSYSPAADVDLSSANIISVDTISELEDDKELQNIQESISSTSSFKGDSVSKKQLDSTSQEDILLDISRSRKTGKATLRNAITAGKLAQYPLSSEDGNQIQKEGQAEETVSNKTWNRNVQAPQVSTVGSSREVSDNSLVSPRRGSKVKHAINVPCQVCSDNAAGFYCGAYICEACKKFYMRAYKQDRMKYVCLRDKNCVITKESRVQCQFCRFQKCVQLNMYCPKQGEGGEGGKDTSMSEIPCRVCSAPSSGFHFGAITCEGCKGFFRRMAKEREPEKYQCTKKGDCEINMLTRNLCKACRYRQCLNAGMSVQGSRIGRQPNSVKHLISMELKNQVKTEPEGGNFGYPEMADDGSSDRLDIKIKEEPVDFLDSSFDKFDCGKDFRQWESLDKLNSSNSGDIVITCVSNQISASAHDNIAQSTYNSIANTSASVSVNSSMPMKRKLSPLQPCYGVNVSEQGSVMPTNYIPVNNVSPNLQSQKPAVTLPGQGPPFTMLGRVPPATNMGQAPANTSRVPPMPNMGQALSNTSRVPPMPNMGQAPGNTSRVPPMPNMGQVPAASLSNQVPFGWNQQTLQSCDQKTSQTQPVSNQLGSMKSVPHGSNRQISPAVLQSGGSKLRQQTGQEMENKKVNRGLYDFSIEGNTFINSNNTKQQSPFEGVGPGVLSNTGDQSKSLEQSNAQQRHRHNSNNTTSPGQLRSNRGEMTSPQPKKPRQQNAGHSRDVGLHANPMMSLGRAGGDKDRVDENCERNMDMPDFIKSIIEAGKCLQLLNYRVFDTDLNPTASMNVDDIKNLFKMKNVDPKAGNQITSSVNMSMFDSKESTWSYMMTNFHHNTYITIRFAKMVPGFKTLTLNDQVKLIQNTIYPIELLNMSKVYDPVTKQYNYFTYTKEEENIMMAHFPMLRVFQEHFLHVGEMVTTFSLTDEEFALLSALLLFPAEISGLEDPKAVEDLQNKVTAALQQYEETRMPDGLTRFGVLLVRVAELIQCLLQHNLAIGLLLTHNPTIKVPQLFHELIIESIKEGQRS